MMEGLFREVIVQIPTGRSAMEITNLLWLMAVKLNAQEVGEKPVIAKPLPAGVQRHEEEILPFQGLQHLLPTRGPGDGVAERPAEAIQNAGLQQEATGLVGQMNEDVFAQVIGDEAMPAADDERTHLALTVQGKRHQL